VSGVLESRIPAIVAGSEAKAEAAVAKTVFDIEAGCKVRSRVDTGQQREGWTGEITGPLEGIVYNPVEHSLYNEFGTESMSAQPMLYPSIEDAREPFYAAMGGVYA
jgi:hypothetical protein